MNGVPGRQLIPCRAWILHHTGEGEVNGSTSGASDFAAHHVDALAYDILIIHSA
jgi:hypothetical protein